MKKLLLMMLLSGVLVQGLEGAAGSATGAPTDGGSGRKIAFFSQVPDGVVLELLKFLSVSDQVNLGKALAPQEAELHPVVAQYVTRMCASLIVTYGVNRILFCPNNSDTSPDAVEHREVLSNHFCVRKLISQGANCLAQRENGITVLHIAAANGLGEIVRVLLEAVTDVRQRMELVRMLYGMNDTALHLAARRGHVEVVRALLEVIPDAEQRTVLVKMYNGLRCTPLHCAARNGHVEVVRALLEAVPDVTQRTRLVKMSDDLGRTALDFAREHGHGEVVEILSPYMTNRCIML